jgi:hypothetical protein
VILYLARSIYVRLVTVISYASWETENVTISCSRSSLVANARPNTENKRSTVVGHHLQTKIMSVIFKCKITRDLKSIRQSPYPLPQSTLLIVSETTTACTVWSFERRAPMQCYPRLRYQHTELDAPLSPLAIQSRAAFRVIRSFSRYFGCLSLRLLQFNIHFIS